MKCEVMRLYFTFQVLIPHTSCETSTHKNTWSAHNVHSKNASAHTSYTAFQTQMSHGKMLHERNFMHTQT